MIFLAKAKSIEEYEKENQKKLTDQDALNEIEEKNKKKLDPNLLGLDFYMFPTNK